VSEPQQPGQPDPQRNPDGKPRRRRRRRRKNVQSGQGGPSTQAGQGGATAQGAAPAGDGVSAVPSPTPKKRPPVRRNRPKPPPVSANSSEDGDAVRPARGHRPGTPAGPPRANRPERTKEAQRKGGGTKGASSKKGPPANAGGSAPPRKKKKKRKVRTKDCVSCYTPHVTIHRVKITHRKQWNFICDICWADRCVDNPHYEYGGLWISGRVMPPESELYAEWLAKRKKHNHGPAALQPETAAAANPSPVTAAKDQAVATTPPDASPTEARPPAADTPNPSPTCD